MIDNIHFFVSLISIFFLTILLFWLYRDYRVDKFREKMFALREELFDYAAKKEISFEHDSYKMIRNTMNGFIRFSHRMNLAHVVICMFLFKKREDHLLKPFSETFQNNIHSLSSEQKEAIKLYRLRMDFLIIEHLILSSPVILITALIPTIFLFWANKHVNKIVKLFRTPLDKLDTAALATGEI